ncbi:phoE Broad specificity phosphatase PhoE and related phosphatases [Burkholderiaceae bacterium]
MHSMTEIWLVRHGETPWNVESRVQGWEDIGLNEHGIEQARSLARHMKLLSDSGTRLDAIYSSDLKRAQHTASIVAESIGLPLALEPGIRERHFGVLQGLIYSEMAQHQPEAYRIWRSRDPDLEMPEGESLGFFHRRVVGAMNNLAVKHPGERIMVVSHGGAMDIIWRHASQVGLQADRKAPLLNASLNRLSVSPESWKILGWGEVDHLGQDSQNDVTP